MELRQLAATTWCRATRTGSMCTVAIRSGAFFNSDAIVLRAERPSGVLPSPRTMRPHRASHRENHSTSCPFHSDSGNVVHKAARR